MTVVWRSWPRNLYVLYVVVYWAGGVGGGVAEVTTLILVRGHVKQDCMDREGRVDPVCWSEVE